MTATIADVAERAGVSTATVSRVLAGVGRARPETQARVLEAARDLGYRPSEVARSLKRRSTQTLGLIITDIENPYFPQLVRAVEDAARAAGYSVLLCNAADDPEREASYLDLRGVDLVVLSACETALGKAESGEGVLGLVQGFQMAGARCVVASLWRVEDEPTRMLMERFYDEALRKENPPPPAEALRRASLWLRSQKGAGGRSFAAPKYWAAFVCYGK